MSRLLSKLRECQKILRPSSSVLRKDSIPYIIALFGICLSNIVTYYVTLRLNPTCTEECQHDMNTEFPVLSNQRDYVVPSENGWVNISGKCYYISSPGDTKTFEEASAFCRHYNGYYLFSLNDETETTALKSYLRKYHQRDATFWIGERRLSFEGNGTFFLRTLDPKRNRIPRHWICELASDFPICATYPVDMSTCPPIRAPAASPQVTHTLHNNIMNSSCPAPYAVFYSSES